MALYAAYAEKFPEMELFWRKLAKEEGWHAHVIREAAQKELEAEKPGHRSALTCRCFTQALANLKKRACASGRISRRN